MFCYLWPRKPTFGRTYDHSLIRKGSAGSGKESRLPSRPVQLAWRPVQEKLECVLVAQRQIGIVQAKCLDTVLAEQLQSKTPRKFAV